MKCYSMHTACRTIMSKLIRTMLGQFHLHVGRKLLHFLRPWWAQTDHPARKSLRLPAQHPLSSETSACIQLSGIKRNSDSETKLDSELKYIPWLYEQRLCFLRSGRVDFFMSTWIEIYKDWSTWTTHSCASLLKRVDISKLKQVLYHDKFSAVNDRVDNCWAVVRHTI